MTGDVRRNWGKILAAARSIPARLDDFGLRKKTGMDTLGTCPCGHTLAAHDGDGCRAERLRSCACRRDRQGALEAAVRAVRTTVPDAGDVFPTARQISA
jgi:hypothetical protein